MIIVYTYYNNPWKMESGDDVRIHSILSFLVKSNKLIVFNLSLTTKANSSSIHDGVVYVCLPRKLYLLLSKIIRWSKHYDLNPLMKLTHYVDEFIATVKLRRELKKADMILVFGSMSLFSLYSRLLGIKKTIVYEPLANYSQTLYLRSRRSLLELLRYGLYLSLHKLEVNSSDVVVYPSRIDLENAICMFKPKKAIIIPNPMPICYESMKEYVSLRARRGDYDKPYFILLAGGKGKANEEAVRVAIEVFNAFPPEKFRLFITGPWEDMKKYMRNPSIELLGFVSREKLKELLAVSDYGLSPVFSHCAGTFLKVLSYISAGLDIIASPCSIAGIDVPIGIKVHLARNREEFTKLIKRITSNYIGQREAISSARTVTLCKDSLFKVEVIETICYRKE